jgi:molybdopterin/thiamine biosynthesis adenylyltransferase/rhodanese-related sulfurtransferase
MKRYVRQTNLPEIGEAGQRRLLSARIAMIGAGGLGAAALPYLAAAGVGHITIFDHDIVSLHNLHRQTIFRMDQIGTNKAESAHDYLKALNPEISVTAIGEKITSPDHFMQNNYDLLIDGSDNFETKALLNDISIAAHIPLLSASVNGFAGQLGIFEGYKKDQACYRCLFPEFPLDARNCNEAGILGTSSGLTGMIQAHVALCYLLGIESFESSIFYSLDLKTMRFTSNKIPKNETCGYCAQTHDKKRNSHPKETSMIEILPLEKIVEMDALIIDVRQPEELMADPLDNPLIAHKPLHIPLGELPSRLSELPRDRTLALICAGNIRSVKGANFLAAQGFTNVCVLDKFTV